MRLQFFCAIDFAQIAVECAERQMTRLSGDFEKEAISEAKRWSRPEDLECRCHHFTVLEDQILVVQELLDRRANLCGITLVDSGQYPDRLGQREERDPRACCHEIIRHANQLGIVARQHAPQDVRFNGAHASFEYIAGSRPSTPPVSEASAILSKTACDGYLRTYIARRVARRFDRRPRPIPVPIRWPDQAFDVLRREQTPVPEK